MRRHRLRRVVIAALGALLLIASTGVAAWVAYERPYRGGISRPLTARAVVDYATGRALLLLDCPISIGRAVVRSTGGLTTVDTRARQASLEIAPPPLPLTLSTESTQFLNRRNVRLTLGPREEGSPWPYRLRLRLEAEREFVLFDSSFPFQRSPEGTTYDISVGAGPPRPLEIGLTLPPDRGLTLVVDALYLSLPQDMSVQAEGAIVDPGLEIRVSFPFTT